jgi:SAM-dependent methyltransferase
MLSPVADAGRVESTAGNLAACPQNCEFVTRFRDVESCVVCGLGRSSYRAAPPEQRNYLGLDRDGVKVARSHRIFDEFMGALAPGVLLDIGCSDGCLLEIAAARGWRTLGIDPQPNSSDRIIRAKFSEYEFGERFDFLALIHSFEHMDDPRATLLQCRTLIKQDGRLLIVVPNFGGWWSRAMGQEWQWLNVADHRYHYTRRALERLLGQAGFRIDACRTYSGFAPSLPEMILSANHVFEWPGIRWRPVRSTLYRLSSLAGIIGNPAADFARQGAELQALARPA